MSRMIVRRRPDGIVQIRPRPLWRAFVGPVPAMLLGLLAACGVLMVVLAAALVQAPALVLLVGGCAILGLAALRFGLGEPGMAEVNERRHPPRGGP